MNKLTGAVLILSGAISGHAVFSFLSHHPKIHDYDVPPDVATMVMVAIVAATVMGVLGLFFLWKNDN